MLLIQFFYQLTNSRGAITILMGVIHITNIFSPFGMLIRIVQIGFNLSLEFLI